MPIRFRCPKCQALMQVADEAAGQRTECPSCQSICSVPRSSAEPTQSKSPPQPKPPGAPKASSSATSPPKPASSTPRPVSPTPRPTSAGSPGSGGNSASGASDSSLIQLRCPSCSQLMRAKAGATVKCPHCSTTVRAPGGSAPKPAPAPSAFSDDIFPTMPSAPTSGYQTPSYQQPSYPQPSYSQPSYSPPASSGFGGGGYSSNPYSAPSYGGGYAGGYSSGPGQWQFITLGVIFIIAGIILVLGVAGSLIGDVIALANGADQPFNGYFILRIVFSLIYWLPIAIIYLTGGANFAKQTGIASARTVAVVACIPCFNCVILTPFGIWAAILVFSEAGKREFDSSY